MCVTALAVLAGGCSSGGGKQSAPSTSASTLTTMLTPTTATSTTTVSPSHAVANLGRCPSKYPAESLKSLNAGVQGLGRTLVPIRAMNVRVCRYEAGASSSAVLKAPYATQLEAETNGLHRVDGGYNCPPNRPPFFFVTFTNDTQQVDVWEAGGCGFVTNGVLIASPTSKWRNELRDYTVHLVGGAPG